MATTKVWFGGIGRFNNGADWSPAGSPRGGDLAFIGAGMVIAKGGTLDNLQFDLQSTIDLADDTLGVRAFLAVAVLENTNQHYSGAIQVSGLVVNDGHIEVGTTNSPGFPNPSGSLNVTLAPDAVLRNETAPGTTFGAMSAQFGSTLHVSGGVGSVLVNDSTLTSVGATFRIDVPVIGTGTLESSSGGPEPQAATLELGVLVSAGETVELYPGGAVILDHPRTFLGSFDTWAPGRALSR